jgi:hypothetical protein
MDFSQTVVSFKNYELEYEQERRNKTRNEEFEQEMRKILKNFQIFSAKNSQKMSYDFPKSI